MDRLLKLKGLLEINHLKLHFADGETEARKGDMTCPGSCCRSGLVTRIPHSQQMQNMTSHSISQPLPWETSHPVGGGQ